MDDNTLEEIAGGFAYGGVGIALLVVGFVVIDLLTPGKLGDLIMKERSKPAAIITAAGLIAISAVVTTSIAVSDGPLGEGLAETAIYGGIGVIMIGVAFTAVDLLTPGRLGDVVHDTEDPPVVWLIAAALLSAGAVVSAAVS